MVKVITLSQLKRAIRLAPEKILEEGNVFLVRGLAEYKRVAVQSSPWRVGQSGGGIPRKTGHLREKHRTKISQLEGRFGVNPDAVPYARRIHEGFKGRDRLGRRYNQDARPWLNYARQRADKKIEKLYGDFMDKVLLIIAT